MGSRRSLRGVTIATADLTVVSRAIRALDACALAPYPADLLTLATASFGIVP